MSPSNRLGMIGLAIFATACGRATAATDDQLHGAASMVDQEHALDLLITAAPTEVPAGIDAEIWAASIPSDNAMSAARVALGRRLYFDRRLSSDGTVACATCHDTTRSFTDRRPVSEGVGAALGQRNAPTTMNAALLPTQFWDSRAPTLEEQAKLPILNPVEMAMPSPEAAVAVIVADPEYPRMFQDAYSRPPSYDDVGRAIAAFERTLIFLSSPFDRFLAGDDQAISEPAKRGWALFNGQGRCMTCHPFNASNPLGSDDRFHNVGVSARHQRFASLAKEALVELAKDPSLANIERLALATDRSELGRFLVSKRVADVGAFRTPQLRNAGITAPYMHDGSMQTLWDVMDHYNKGGEANRFLDGGIEPLALDEQQIDDLVAFMFTLTDERLGEANAVEQRRQRDLAETQRPFRDDDLAQRRTIVAATPPSK
jgi:cytochrome c peroxidase